MKTPYEVVLYDSGKRIKVMGSFRTYSEALGVYKEVLKSNKTYFPKVYNWLGIERDYELALTGPESSKSIEHFRDDKGALVKVKTGGEFVIKKISPYSIEEKFKHKNTNKIYEFKTLVKDFLIGDTTKVIISINNKLVIEYFENEGIDVFILKNSNDSQRLNETIRSFSLSNNLNNFIFFNEPTKDTIKRIYDSLELNYGISRRWMSKVSTR